MKIHVTKHAIERFCERARPCSPEVATRQIEAIYAHGKRVITKDDGSQIFRLGEACVVKALPGKIVTFYFRKEMPNGKEE